MADSPPTVVILAGPNGAGKTTAAKTLLAETLRLTTYVNADVIAQGLWGFDPESAALDAGRIMLKRLDVLTAQRRDFAFETTLAGRGLVGRLKALRDSGWTSRLLYFWLESADVAVARVASRVQTGGHSIPEATIRRRYVRSLHNFFHHYRSLVTTWKVYNNTEADTPRLVAYRDVSGDETVVMEFLWRQMQSEAHR